MKPCGGCAKRREMLRKALAKIVKPKPAPEPEAKPAAPDKEGAPA